MLFNGDQLPPQRARGLMWLTLARDSARRTKPGSRKATIGDRESVRDDRAMALQMLKDWVQGRTD
jgi:hypothetical protein